MNVKRDANRGEIKSAYIHLARLHHPDNNPSPESELKFNEIQNAYREAMKYAEPGEDRTKHEDRHKVRRPEKKEYSFVNEIPEYTKVIEAENVQSQVDAEAEFNRDVNWWRGFLLLIGSSCLLIGCAIVTMLTPSLADEHREFKTMLRKERDATLVPHTQQKIDRAAVEEKF